MSGTTCHIAHTDPKIMLVFNALHRSCIGSTAYPIQPTSSPTAGIKNATKNIGIARNGMYGSSGSGSLIRRITPYDSKQILGIKKMMGTYQIFCLILLGMVQNHVTLLNSQAARAE